MTLKQKLAEKEHLAAEKVSSTRAASLARCFSRRWGNVETRIGGQTDQAMQKAHGDDDDELMDTLTIQERRRMAREREMEADMAVASDLMGGMSVEDSEPCSVSHLALSCSFKVLTHFPDKEALQAVLTSKPTTKEAFSTLSKQIMASIISRHEFNPLFASFAEQLAKDLCESLTAVQTRKVSSSLSVLGNTKQQEERDKASGKKKVGVSGYKGFEVLGWGQW